MTTKSIEQRVREVLADQHVLDSTDIVLSLPLQSPALGITGDSLDRVEIVMALEDEFGIQIPDWDADNLNTVQDAIEYCTAPPHPTADPAYKRAVAL